MIIAGVGFRAGATSADILEILRRAEDESGCEIQLLAAPEFKASQAALLETLAMLGLPLIAIDQLQLQRAQVRCPTQSRVAMAAVGSSSVAEGCALAALDEGARLVLPRIANARATCALASGDRP